MAKRFTDTDKWKKPFIKTLPVEYKIFWMYLLDECDNAGIWHVELDLAEMRLGIKLSHQKIRGFFKERIVEFDNETKWFLPDFVSFQYGELDIKNRAHKSVIDRLNKYNLLKSIKVVVSPLQGAKDKDKELDKEDKSGEIKKIAKSVFDDAVWTETVCMGFSLTKEELKKWMARYNASLMADELKGFTENTYKKWFGGWLNTQRGKGYTINDTQQTTTSQPLKTLN